MEHIRLYESKHQDDNCVREHHHAQHQFLYALNGKGQATLEGKTYTFDRNVGMMIVPYSSHAIQSESKLTVLVLAFDERALDADVRERLLRDAYPRSRLLRLSPIADNELRRSLRKMLFEQSNRTDPYRHAAMRVYLEQLLLALVRNGNGQTAAAAPNANSLRAEKLKHYIDTHYYEIENAEQLASRLGVSARHLNTIFKEAFGVTPLQYLTEVRMGLAKRQLAETDKDIASICFELGFESLSTFYRTFRQGAELSPNQFRRMAADSDEPVRAIGE